MEQLNDFFDLNKLFATFTTPAALEETVININRRYSILFSKIFILESPQSDELICTYNIDTGNMSASPMANTILLHRKKESNTLYTINALNTLIKSLNGGRMDKNFLRTDPLVELSIIREMLDLQLITQEQAMAMTDLTPNGSEGMQ